MKILLIQEKGRHKKNENFRESENLKRSLERLNIDTKIWGLNYENFNISFEEIIKDRDIIISLENYDSGWIPDLSKITKLKVFWSIDSHCILKNHLETVSKNKFDIVLNAIEDHQKYFKHLSKTFYFPNAYPSDLIFPKEDIRKEFDVGFCGSLISDRDIWLRLLEKKFNVKRDIFVLGEDMVNALNSYKISFNKTLSDDINFRIFETLGCKTFLITNKPPKIENLFQDEKHLVYYSSPKELIEKITFYLNHEKKMKEIAENGYNEVLKHHSYDIRAKQLIELLKDK